MATQLSRRADTRSTTAVVLASCGAVALVLLAWRPVAGQRPAGDTSPDQAVVVGGCSIEDVVAFHACASEKAQAFRAPRTDEGAPDFQGYWRSRNNNAAYNIEPAEASFGIPASGGHIIDTPDRLVPYQPWALARRNELRGKGFEDPQAHCAPSGSPRKNVTLFGWRIIQPAGHVLFLYESMHDYRIIPTSGRPHIPASIRLWHGDPVGRWERDTLVVDFRNLNGRHWFDMSGNFQSEHIHVEERYTMYHPDAILFEARVDDETMYTRPWTLAFALERNQEEGYYQIEYACHEGERDLQHLAAAP